MGKHLNDTAAMERRGWSETRICEVLGENRLRDLVEVWGGRRLAALRHRIKWRQ